MIQILSPINIVAYSTSYGTTLQGEIVVRGKDSSCTMRVSKAVAAAAKVILDALPVILPQDPLDDQGALNGTDPATAFTASYIGFDNSCDNYHTVMVAKKGTRDFLMVDMVSTIREDMKKAIDFVAAIV